MPDDRPPPRPRPGDETASGIIEDLDDDVARVTIGDSEDEWLFPLELLPRGVAVGTCLWFVRRDGRWVPLGIAQERPTANSRTIEDRLGRHIVDRRLGGEE